jgi:hypothetical protein
LGRHKTQTQTRTRSQLYPEYISTDPIQSIDDALVSAVKKVDNLSKYLKTPWGLSRGDRFHELKF